MAEEENYRELIGRLSELSLSILDVLGEHEGGVDLFSHPNFCDLPEQTMLDAMQELENEGLIYPPEVE